MVTDPQGMAYLETAENELARVSHIAKQTLGYYREHSSAKLSSISELVENALGANVAQVPHFICAFGDFFHPFWQTIMRVREHKNAPRLFP